MLPPPPPTEAAAAAQSSLDGHRRRPETAEHFIYLSREEAEQPKYEHKIWRRIIMKKKN